MEIVAIIIILVVAYYFDKKKANLKERKSKLYNKKAERLATMLEEELQYVADGVHV